MTKHQTFLSAAEVARQMGCSPSTVLRRITRGELPATKLPGRTGSYVIDAEDLERYRDQAAVA